MPILAGPCVPEVTAQGHTAHWQSFANGPDRVVAVHCTMGHSAMWKGLAMACDGQMRWDCLDMIGHGGSDKWDRTAEFTGANVAVLLHLLESPAHLVGHSYGAAIALIAAVARPEMVKSLTFYEPMFPAFARDNPDFDGLNAENVPFRDAMAAGDIESAARLFMARWGTGKSWDEMSPRAQARAIDDIHMIDGQAKGITDDLYGMTKSGALDALTMPVTLVEGSTSPALIDAMNAAFAARLKDAQRITVEGAGHMVPVTHPVAALAALRQTVSRAQP